MAQRTAAALAFTPALLSVFLFAAGAPFATPVAVFAAVLVALVWRRQSRAATRGTFAVPAGDESTVLRTAAFTSPATS